MILSRDEAQESPGASTLSRAFPDLCRDFRFSAQPMSRSLNLFRVESGLFFLSVPDNANLV